MKRFMENPLNKYLLVISPEERISNQITQIKYEFANSYGCTCAAQLKPHCTLLHFIQHPITENYLVKNFDVSAAYCAAMKITLNGFGQYPRHTIYINVEEYRALKNMVETLRFKTLSGIKLISPVYLTDPHVTIARNMTEKQFTLAWKEWENRKFEASFTAHSIRLLKRKITEKDLGTNEKYQVVKDFELGGKKDTNEQLRIF
ncbi:MAG: 2'-5' RNA ligase family protein [Pedobacter sp.]|uniref:2'-5' RNA ligase family protein n=1 Tax=Pedobacter sp. TaxID=1411316 RepID=UPI0033911E8C